jgi:hypothetical protein
MVVNRLQNDLLNSRKATRASRLNCQKLLNWKLQVQRKYQETDVQLVIYQLKAFDFKQTIYF